MNDEDKNEPDEKPQERSLEVIEAVDETIKWIAGTIGVILLENKDNHDCVAALPIYNYDSGEKSIGLIFKKDKIMRVAVCSVLAGIEELAKSGTIVSFMTHDEGLKLIREYVDIGDAKE